MAKMTAKVEKVTPDTAFEWLTKKNTHNRRIRQAHVDLLARDMREGRWELSGQPIVFGDDGVLMDGQHRLTAVVEAEVAVEFLIVRGADPKAFDVIDFNVPRGAHDVLYIQGATNPTRLSSAARVVLLNEKYPTELWEGNRRRVSRTEVSQFALEHESDLHKAVNLSTTWQKEAAGIKQSVSAAIYIINAAHGFDVFAETDRGSEFSEGVTYGTNLAPGSPVLALRKVIMTTQKQSGTWASQRMVIAVLRAWNYFVANETTEFLKITRGALPMPVPAVIKK